MKANYMVEDKRKTDNLEFRKLILCGSIMSEMILQNNRDLKRLAEIWQHQLEQVRKSCILDKL
jgi:hypothetical protein